MADILCSMVKPIQDIPASIDYIFTGWFLNNELSDRSSGYLYYIVCFLGVLPFYFWLMQCIWRYYDTKDAFPHLVNGLKYLSSMVAIVIGYIITFKGQYWYITVAF